MTSTSSNSVVPTGPVVGQVAPDFTLKDQQGRSVSLSDYRGIKNVVVVFYPFAFSGICTGELCEIRDNLGDFESDDVQVLAVSCDHMFTQRAWSDAEGYFFPMLSDYWPHGATAQAYGCLLYTSDAADDLTRVDLGGRRIIKKKKKRDAGCVF